MIYIYLVIAIVSSILFCTDMVLRYMEKIRSFGSEKPLVKRKGSTIPIEFFFPMNITMLIVFFVILGVSGMSLSLAGLVWFLSLPCAISSGTLGIFIYQYAREHIKKKYMNKAPPGGETAAGVEGRTLEYIPADDYGRVEFEWNGEWYTVNAVSANETPLVEHERVIIILEEDGVYFVESITEVFDILNSPDS